MDEDWLDEQEKQIKDVIAVIQRSYEKALAPWIQKLAHIQGLRPGNYRMEAEQYAQLAEQGLIKSFDKGEP